MRNDVDTAELQEMKRQLETLSRRLEQEMTVDEEALRRVVTGRVRTLDRRSRMLRGVLLVAAPYCLFSSRAVGFSWPFGIVTAAFLLVAFCYDRYAYAPVRRAVSGGSALVDVARELVRLKRLNAGWFRFSIPFLLVWITWFLCEAMSMSMEGDYLAGFLSGAVVGGLTGGLIGLRYYRRTKREIQEILQQIAEASDEGV